MNGTELSDYLPLTVTPVEAASIVNCRFIFAKLNNYFQQIFNSTTKTDYDDDPESYDDDVTESVELVSLILAGWTSFSLTPSSGAV